MTTHWKENKELLAYTAGIIDGEGTIGMYRRYDKPNFFRPLIAVTNTHFGLLEFLKSSFGMGTIQLTRKAMNNWKEARRWSIDTKLHAREFLSAIEPYLLIKRNQAKLLIEYIDAYPTYGSKRDNLSARLSRQEFYMRIKSLNQRAIPPETTERVRLLKKSMQQSDLQRNEVAEGEPKSFPRHMNSVVKEVTV